MMTYSFVETSCLKLFSKYTLIVALVAAFSIQAEEKIPDECKVGGFAIGCIVYTFDHANLFDSLDMTAQTGARVVELAAKPSLSKEDPKVPFDYHASPAVIQKVKAKLAECHLKPVTYAVIPFPAEEKDGRQLFEFAKTMGLRAIVTESPELIDRIEKLAKEFDIMVGFHDHPRHQDDDSYKMWDPNYVLSLVKDRDWHLGACADTGHWVRSGLKPVDCLRILKGRIVCSHLKDLNVMGRGAHDVPFGTGVSDIGGILDELKAQNFQGSLSLNTNIIGILPCLKFLNAWALSAGMAWPKIGDGK